MSSSPQHINHSMCSCSAVAICNLQDTLVTHVQSTCMWNHLGITLPLAVSNKGPLSYIQIALHLFVTHYLPDLPIGEWAKGPNMKLITHLHQILRLRVTGSVYLLSHMPSWREEKAMPGRYIVGGTMIWVGGRLVQILVANCIASTSCLKNVFSVVPVVYVWCTCVYTCACM
jgi:hypothetical protein